MPPTQFLLRRRASLPIALTLSLFVFSGFVPALYAESKQNKEKSAFDIAAIERPRIMHKAAEYLKEEPLTVTAFHSDRSQDGKHDFFSEGDYWWPDPERPDGPYIERDGVTNPDNFVEHRRAMIRMDEIVATMASAYVLTGDDKYVKHAVKHLKAWFVDEDTKMNPSLEDAQAVKGRVKGRSWGVIDTIHLVEVARATEIISQSSAFSRKDFGDVKAWFRQYLTWLTTSENGMAERAAKNNHGICWSMQAAAFAHLVGDEDVLSWVRNEFKTVYLTTNMQPDGGFPAELARTKPYGYSLFVLDAMAGIAQIASTPKENLWTYETSDHRGMKRALEFIFPYVQDKSKWPFKHDVLYWDEWPVRQPSLLFGGVALDKPEYLKVWESLKADSDVAEVTRNVPLRYPLLWLKHF